MGASLLRKGHQLMVWNRTPAKADGLVQQGATWAGSPAAAAASAEVIIASLGDDEASKAVWLGKAGALSGAQPGAIAVDTSTLTPAWVRELAGVAGKQEVAFLDAPVTGSKDAAASGDLVLFIGGESSVIERAHPALAAISRRQLHFGPVGSGAVFKLVNNLMSGVHALALAESLMLAEAAGLDMQQVVATLINGGNGSPLVKGKAARIANHDYDDTHFALQWMRKDISYVLRLGEELGVALPTSAAAREAYQLALNAGRGSQDFCAVAEVLRRRED
jgi:3-hydroxyisobutyrate dehydrogenase